MWIIITINVISCLLMGFDKIQAIHKRYRIPELVFFVLSAFSGFMGIFIAMYVFRHKNRKPKFIFMIVFGALLFGIASYQVLK